MITAKVFVEDNCLYGFSVEGHSGLAEDGEDILCAAVTSAVRLVETTLTDTLKLSTIVEVEEGFVSLEVPTDLQGELAFMVAHLFLGFEGYLRQLTTEYPAHLTLSRV